MNGFLNLNKEAGMTSHDEVLRARELLGIRKVGHLGTLDPLATGVLVLCIGSGTKLVSYLEHTSKAYRATVALGMVTDTMDISGRVLETRPVAPLSPDAASQILERFCGQIEQIPPMYSAVKVRGNRLYKLARRGIEVERQPRQITIFRLVLQDLRENSLTIEIECSKGTYIRTLCADIGQALGCGGCLRSLVRTRVGPFRLEESLTYEQLCGIRERGEVGKVLWSLDQVLSDYPQVVVPEKVADRVRHGSSFREDCLAGGGSPVSTGTMMRVYDPSGNLLALAELQWDQMDKGLSRIFRISRLLVPG
ncbi:MAG: tRNA pseudouridine(55) synthase TruB [Candidatus Tectomicrobia bacterium]|uniref:tRNA pseudouridine synthase B n=1 Tax=Tectimicrobiota bacterium TaxID=2528274 RepID=A0A932GN51_UNCTE|nr:tRNA pseudouridine(55) synthase TruB [Candidatus Tectomicrobia bacterium]